MNYADVLISHAQEMINAQQKLGELIDQEEHSKVVNWAQGCAERTIGSELSVGLVWDPAPGPQATCVLPDLPERVVLHWSGEDGDDSLVMKNTCEACKTTRHVEIRGTSDYLTTLMAWFPEIFPKQL